MLICYRTGDIHFDHHLKELGVQAELLGHWLLQYSISYEESVSMKPMKCAQRHGEFLAMDAHPMIISMWFISASWVLFT